MSGFLCRWCDGRPHFLRSFGGCTVLAALMVLLIFTIPSPQRPRHSQRGRRSTESASWVNRIRGYVAITERSSVTRPFVVTADNFGRVDEMTEGKRCLTEKII
jgi:hypothetical protein